jgi:hypothetical protein
VRADLREKPPALLVKDAGGIVFAADYDMVSSLNGQPRSGHAATKAVVEGPQQADPYDEKDFAGNPYFIRPLLF